MSNQDNLIKEDCMRCAWSTHGTEVHAKSQQEGLKEYIQLERYRRRGEDDNKMDLKDIGWKDVY